MSSEADRFWDEYAGKLRKKKGFCPLTPEEAIAAFNAAEDAELSEDRIDSIVEAAITGETGVEEADEHAAWDGDSELDEVAEDAHQLCRHGNEEDEDADADKTEQDLEDELLKDDEEEDET